MNGYLLLADGLRLDGTLRGAPGSAYGHLAANTSVVGFQEMATDPVYRGRILAFTYPEVGNVGVARPFNESAGVQAAALVVKVLSEFSSHYLAEDSMDEMLQGAGVPCLCGVDTRGVAVHLRENGEMAAAVAPARTDPEDVYDRLKQMKKPAFEPTEAPEAPEAEEGPVVAVLDLGVRRSQLAQLSRVSRPRLFPWDADPEQVRACEPAGLFISDGPGTAPPPKRTVETVRALRGSLPVLGCGLGHVAVGMACGCEPAFLRRGHHGANYPVRNRLDGSTAVTQQRHTVMLDRQSVESCEGVELVWENINDGTVEGIRSPDGSALGLQETLPAPQSGLVNAHLKRFVEWISGK
ncbi:MAG: carbamoyl phosphate synthase small subunit [Planctomycetota bacterium]